MKKKIIPIVIIIIIIAVATTAYFIIQKQIEEGRKYTIAEVNEYKYFILKEGEKFGVIDKLGNKIIEPQYENLVIPNPEQGIFICYEGENSKTLNESNQQILTGFERLEPLRLKDLTGDLVYEKTILKYEQNGKYGIIDFEGNKLTDAIYEEIDTLQYKEGELLVKKDEKYGVINLKGVTLVNPEYDQISADRYYEEEEGYKNSGYIVSNTTEEGYRYGYVNLKGKRIIDIKYNEMYRIGEIKGNDSFIICAENGKYGLFKNSDKIIENEYQSLIYNENNQTISAAKGKRYGVFSLDGKNIIPFEYSQIDTTGDYFYATLGDGTTKVFDKNGKTSDMNSGIKVLNTENDAYKIYIEVQHGKTIYNIYKNGVKVTKNAYTFLQYLYDNYFIAANSSGKLGIINDENKIIVKPQYTSIQKIDDTNLVEVSSSETNITEIYSEGINKLLELKNAKISMIEEYIKVYNGKEEKYITKSGQEVTDINSLLKKPTKIGEYEQIIYGNGEIYYTIIKQNSQK